MAEPIGNLGGDGLAEGYVPSKAVREAALSCQRTRHGPIARAQIAGVDAARLIAPLAPALDRGLDARSLAKVAFPHPMPSEGINKVARHVVI
jgi:hypothetical protein